MSGAASTALSKERRHALALLLERKGISAARPARIPKRAPAESVRASHAQERIWQFSREPGAGPAFLTSNAVRLHGPLDAALLRRALDTIAARHESLRSVYEERDGALFQRVALPAHFALRNVDLRGYEGEAQAALVQREMLAEATDAFDLARGPVIRGRLLQLGQAEHLLLLTAHRVIYDGWSRGMLIEEMGTLYTSYSRAEGNPLPAIEVQYGDYAEWQRAQLETSLPTGLAYWREQLVGAPDLLQLPTTQARTAQRGYRGSAFRFTFDPQLSAELRALTRRFDLTLFMTLLTGWALLMSKLSGQADVVVGGLIANRHHRDVERLIGAFVNHLPIRVDMRNDPTIAALLEQVKERTLGAYAHQWVPVIEIARALRPDPAPSHHPLFQVTLMLDNVPPHNLTMPDLGLGVEDTPVVAAEYDLSLSLKEGGEVIDGHLVFASDLYERATLERWMGRYAEVLRQMCRAPNGAVSALSLGKHLGDLQHG